MRKILTPALLAAAMSSGAAPVLAEESGEDKQQDSMLERAADSAGEYMAGAALTARVKTRLATESALSPFKVGVESTRGVVTLSGDVSSEAERRLAERIAEDVEGVVAVHNALRVRAEAGGQ
jgi:hyperosmotically inducible protein